MFRNMYNQNILLTLVFVISQFGSTSSHSDIEHVQYHQCTFVNIKEKKKKEKYLKLIKKRKRSSNSCFQNVKNITAN